MLATVVGAVLPVVVTVLPGVVAAWHHDFGSKDAPILNRLLFGSASAIPIAAASLVTHLALVPTTRLLPSPNAAEGDSPGTGLSAQQRKVVASRPGSQLSILTAKLGETIRETVDMAEGFVLYIVKAVRSRKGDDVSNLARTNLWR